MAEEFKGFWVLGDCFDDNERAVLQVDRYGPRIISGFYDDEGVLVLLPRQSPPYLTSESLERLNVLILNVWQCQACDHWIKGDGDCPVCWAKQGVKKVASAIKKE